MTLSINIKNLTQRYVEAGCSVAELSKLFRTSSKTMTARLQHWGLKTKKRSQGSGKPKSNKQSERNKELCELFLKNKWTLQECGDHFGITRERARQILEKNGIIASSIRARKKSKKMLAFKQAWLIGLSTKELNEMGFSSSSYNGVSFSRDDYGHRP